MGRDGKCGTYMLQTIELIAENLFQQVEKCHGVLRYEK